MYCLCKWDACEEEELQEEWRAKFQVVLTFITHPWYYKVGIHTGLITHLLTPLPRKERWWWWWWSLLVCIMQMKCFWAELGWVACVLTLHMNRNWNTMNGINILVVYSTFCIKQNWYRMCIFIITTCMHNVVAPYTCYTKEENCILTIVTCVVSLCVHLTQL